MVRVECINDKLTIAETFKILCMGDLDELFENYNRRDIRHGHVNWNGIGCVP